jgi:integrase
MAPWGLQRAMRSARRKVPGLPDGFRLHDLRHFSASLLIDNLLSVKEVQARLRHKKSATTLDTYSHLFDKADERTSAFLDAERPAFLA